MSAPGYVDLATARRMVQAEDPIIRQARRRASFAARHLARGRAELRAAVKLLERHPDCIRIKAVEREKRSVEDYTLAYWAYDSIHSLLCETDLDDLPELVREESRPGMIQRTLATFILDDRRDRAKLARRARRLAKAA